MKSNMKDNQINWCYNIENTFIRIFISAYYILNGIKEAFMMIIVQYREN